jgi:hypothetical protein
MLHLVGRPPQWWLMLLLMHTPLSAYGKIEVKLWSNNSWYIIAQERLNHHLQDCPRCVCSRCL